MWCPDIDHKDNMSIDVQIWKKEKWHQRSWVEWKWSLPSQVYFLFNVVLDDPLLFFYYVWIHKIVLSVINFLSSMRCGASFHQSVELFQFDWRMCFQPLFQLAIFPFTTSFLLSVNCFPIIFYFHNNSVLLG